MTRRVVAGEYGTLGLLLVAVAALSATAIIGCGDGGGSADGGLCSECGVSPDGPCLTEVIVAPGPDAPVPCRIAVPDPAFTCSPIKLTCRRKVDSAQQRCFPLATDPQFECDGARAGGTAVPDRTATPTPTATPTTTGVTPTPTDSVSPSGGTASPTPDGSASPTPSGAATETPTATATAAAALCGNGVVDDDEDCDGTELDGAECGEFCEDDGGTLACRDDCTFDFTGCLFPPCSTF